MLNNFTDIKKFTPLGEVTFLMGVSFLHKNYRIRDVPNNIFPPIQLNQFRIYKIASQAVGFVSWAYLSDELAEKFCSEPTIIKLEDWRSSDYLFFMNFIAPFGPARKIIQNLRYNIFPARQMAKALRFKESGKVKKVGIYSNKNYAKSF